MIFLIMFVIFLSLFSLERGMRDKEPNFILDVLKASVIAAIIFVIASFYISVPTEVEYYNMIEYKNSLPDTMTFSQAKSAEETIDDWNAKIDDYDFYNSGPFEFLFEDRDIHKITPLDLSRYKVIPNKDTLWNKDTIKPSQDAVDSFGIDKEIKWNFERTRIHPR